MISKEKTMNDAGLIRELYLDLMKKCLTNLIYEDMEMVPIPCRGIIKGFLTKLFGTFEIRLMQPRQYDIHKRLVGLDWPPTAHTMIGLKRLDNIQFCLEDVIRKNVPGDVIETGVWRGGSVIFMRSILKSYGISDRNVWVADSFEGLPAPDPDKYPSDGGDRHYEKKELQVSLEQVKSNFSRYDLLDDQVRFLKGWFKDTLPEAPIERLAILRLDGDMYESTMDALNNLYSKLSVGGYLIVDDYALTGCRQAINDFRASHGISDEIVVIDESSVYWQRSC